MRRYWPEWLAIAFGAALLVAMIMLDGCGWRGRGACKPPQRAQSESSPTPHTCEVRR